jgi:hypothetical protein
MNFPRPLLNLVAGALALGCTVPALAHDPGLSLAELSRGEGGWSVHLAFALRDVETLLPVDADGPRSAAGFEQAMPRLQALLSRGIQVRDDQGREFPLRDVTLQRVPGDALHLRARLASGPGMRLHYAAPVIGWLGRGHRQYLRVLDGDGTLVGEHVLGALDPEIPLQRRTLGTLDVLIRYLREGLRHIWIGLDHILFLLTLMLPAVLVYRDARWRPRAALRPAATEILKVVSAFTLAHSITLSLAALQLVALPPRWVESVIAASVVVAACHNLRPVFGASRWMLAFGFGLVHGFGFANALSGLGLPDAALSLALLGFNLGVEAGQLAIVALIFPLAWALRAGRLYRVWVLKGGSMAAIVIAGLWLWERVFDMASPA